MKRILQFLLLCLASLSYAQVGINTNDPKEMLHVNGTMRVEGTGEITNTASLVGVDTDGNLTTVNLENTLDLVDNELILRSGITYGIGSVDLGSITGNFIHDLDLKLGPGEVNQGKSVIKVYNTPGVVTITGFKGRVEGLHLFFYHFASPKITFFDAGNNKTESFEENRILTLANSQGLTGFGCVEFIYDGVAKKWILLSFVD
jgi:hypothetical protein